MRTLIFGLAALSVFGFGTPAPAQPGQDTKVHGPPSGLCGVLFGFNFSDESISVHASPDGNSPVLGTILGVNPRDENRRGPQVRLLEARDGWVRIIDAHDDESLLEGVSPRQMYSGAGWVRGDEIHVIVQASKAFAFPSHEAAVVFEIAEGGWLDEAGRQEIIGCEDDWVLARWEIKPGQVVSPLDFAVVSRDPLTVEGWATGVCSAQETTCDGIDGDAPPRR